MRIKILTDNPKDDKKTLDSNKFVIVDKDETHILIELSNDNILGKKNSIIKPINPSKVLYVESFGNDIFCHTEKDRYKIDSKLYEYVDEYSKLGFIQINKSCVININYITSIYPLVNMRYIVKLSNNDELFVTRTYLKAFKKRIKGGNHGIL